MTVPFPPDETADDVRAYLRRNNPDLSDEQIDALLSGEPPKRKPTTSDPKNGWYVAKGKHGGAGAVHRRDRNRRR